MTFAVITTALIVGLDTLVAAPCWPPDRGGLHLTILGERANRLKAGR
jgi:hypothetical protein